jgi:Zn-dependent protease
MELLDAVFIIAIIMLSAVVHEVMHGVAADKLGDPTARYAGRLTLNPIPHLDPFGSVLLPLLLAVSGSPIFFGWAKPVPYNPYNLVRAPYWGEAIVAFAGPASNFAIALVTALIMRAEILSPEINAVLFIVVITNHARNFQPHPHPAARRLEDTLGVPAAWAPYPV